jgi:hypothetical protein
MRYCQQKVYRAACRTAVRPRDPRRAKGGVRRRVGFAVGESDSGVAAAVETGDSRGRCDAPAASPDGGLVRVVAAAWSRLGFGVCWGICRWRP